MYPDDRKAYAIDPKPLGFGGYATVYGATVKATGERVAFKRLLASSQEDVARFRREVDVQRELDGHPHVMPILAVDPAGRWLVMPLADGDAEDYAAELRGEQALTVFVRHAAEGLRAAHALGRVHRDVTPANLLAFVESGGLRWVVADWGLVRQPHGKTTQKWTKTGVVIGTEGFIAPEVLRDSHRQATDRADVYSLGRVVAWAVVGRRPLAGERLIPAGPFRQLVREATRDEPEQRPDMKGLLDLLNEIVFTPEPDLLERIEALVERDRNGDSAGGAQVLQIALDERDNEDVFFDGVAYVNGQALRQLIRADVDDAEALVGAMRTHLEQTNWDGRHYDTLNRPLRWLQFAASHAIAAKEYGLAEDAAEALFAAEPRWSRFEQRRHTRGWLNTLSGDGAVAVARALKRSPAAADWYGEDEWRAERTAHPHIRSALEQAQNT